MVDRLLGVELMGGMGNQFFQIANGIAFAKRFGLELCFPERWNTRADRLPIWNTYFKDSNYKWNLLPKSTFESIQWHTLRETQFAYSPLQLPKGFPFYKLYGYFQSSQYFSEYAKEIREILQVPKYLLEVTSDMISYKNINPRNGWIAAHVRRGDYLSAADFHVVTTPQYFKTARIYIDTHLQSTHHVCWITDDYEWVKENIWQEGDYIISGDALTDFAILSKFPHMILSNSSYSWWAAWLNPYNYTDRTICCPSRWFGQKGPQDYETIFEPEWIRIT